MSVTLHCTGYDNSWCTGYYLQCLLHDGEKHLNFVEDGRNECWLKLTNERRLKSHNKLTMSETLGCE